jgi:hypothetical protein
MTPEEKLKGLKTSVKLTLSVMERLEALNEDFQVGVKCLSVEKADYVYKLLDLLLEPLKKDFGFHILRKDECVLEVAKHSKKTQVQVLDKEEEKLSTDFQKALEVLQRDDDSDSTDSSSGSN